MNKNELENKAWYRFLKVIFIIAFIPAILMIADVFYESSPSFIIWFILGYLVVLFGIRKAVLYVILGRNKKNE